MMMPVSLPCGCQVNYYPNQVFVGADAEPTYVSHAACAEHSGIQDHPAVLAECARQFDATP